MIKRKDMRLHHKNNEIDFRISSTLLVFFFFLSVISNVKLQHWHQKRIDF